MDFNFLVTYLNDVIFDEMISDEEKVVICQAILKKSNVVVQFCQELSNPRWAIYPNDSELWLVSYETKKDAIDFCVKLGLPYTVIENIVN